jgi:hypothetical protein
LYFLLPALTKGEYRAIKLASRTAVCSDLDRRYLVGKYGLPGVVTIPNAVEIPELEPISPEPNLLFLGSVYQPNVDAAQYLVNDIWPLIRMSVAAGKADNRRYLGGKADLRQPNPRCGSARLRR